MPIDNIYASKPQPSPYQRVARVTEVQIKAEFRKLLHKQISPYRLLRDTSSPDSGSQEADGVWNVADVVEMRRGDGESSEANKIAGVANDLSLLRWEVWDAASVL